MPEWSNGVDSKSTGLAPTQVRTLFPAYRNKMNKKTINLILLSVILIVSAQLMLKYGLKNAGEIDISNISPFFQNALLSPFVILGIIFFAISSALWLMVLSKAELSYAYPILSLGYVLATIGAWLLFNENVNAIRLTGILIICAGVIALSRS